MSQEIMEPTNKRNRILFTALVVVLTAGVIGGSVWYGMNQITKEQNTKIEELQKNQKDEAKNGTRKEEKAKAVETKPTDNDVVPDYAKDWYKFASSNYGFTFRYPKTGIDVIVQGQPPKACKNPLTVAANDRLDGSKEYLKLVGAISSWTYGEFFRIDIFQEDSTLVDFVKKRDPEGVRNYDIVSITGAKEAIKLNNKYNKKFEGYPPLSYASYIVKDGKYIYEFKGFQSYGFSGDCTPNSGDPERVIKTFNFKN